MSVDEQTELERLRGELSALRAAAGVAEGESLLEVIRVLRRDASRYRSVFVSMSEGVVVQASDGEIVNSNAAAEHILGLSSDQLAGRTSLDPRWWCVREDGRPFEGESHPAMVTLRTGEAQRDVLMGVHKPDGSLSWISINSHPLVGSEGERDGVVTTFTDQTEKRGTADVLRRSEEHLRIALAAAQMGTWSWDIASGAVQWSDQLAAIFDVPLEDLGRSIPTYLELVHPEDREEIRLAIDRAVSSEDEGERYEVEHRVVRRDGTVRWIYGFGMVQRDEAGTPTGMIGTALDISDRKALVAQLQQAQKMESVGRLAGGIAHDFNNLMTVVLGAAGLARRAGSSGQDADGHLLLIQEAAERAGRLTQRLLAFARRQMLTLRPVQPSELIRGMHALLDRLIGEDVELAVTLDGTSLVRADPSQLEQVIVNLVVNACDAMPRGGHLAIRVHECHVEGRAHGAVLPVEPGPHVVIDVVDNGMGMDDGQLSRVCEPFYTTKETGSGLGLSTCYGIISQLSGSIRFDSRPGAGTTVSVMLPVLEGVALPEKVAADRSSEGGAETVLVVEDEQIVRDVTVQALRMEGYRVLSAVNADQALEVLTDPGERISLLITDVVMPGMNGVELARHVREKHPAIAVLLVSGYPGEALDARGACVGDFVLVPKPYTSSQLHAKVRELLDPLRAPA